MERNQGFLANFNFPIKKTIRNDAKNVLGLRKKENALVQSSYLPTPLNESDSASDIERKIDKAQLIAPQRSSKINKILDTSSSNATNSKGQEANVNSGPKEAKSSTSISFPPSNPAENVQGKETVTDTEIFTDDEEMAEIQPQSPVKAIKRQPVSDTIIFNTEDAERELQEQAAESSVEEVFHVLDSDDEAEINNLNPPERNPKESYYNCSESRSNITVSNFFNNPPSVDPRMAVRHSDIRRLKINQQGPVEKPSLPPPIDEVGDKEEENRSFDDVGEEEIEIGPTDEEDNAIDLTHDSPPPPPSQKPATPLKPQRSSEIVLSKNTPRTISAQISTPKSDKKTRTPARTNINIKIDLKISIREGSDSESSSNSSTPSGKSSPEPQQNSSSSNEENRVENFTGKNTPTLERKPGNGEEVKTPVKEDTVIDDDLQELLSNLYGESWKTPQLLRSCKSSRVRENLRKSIHANNFESFVRNLSADLESTRVTPSVKKGSSKKKKDDEFRVPIAPPVSSKKTTAKKKVRSDSEQSTPSSSSHKSLPKSTAKATPKYLEICDPETSSSDDSGEDEDFNPNDTWNASSDEDYESESERIKKQQIRRTMHKVVVEEELTFVRDESIEEQSKLEKLLEKYEFTKPTQIKEIVRKKSKRKLFSHSHDDDDDDNEIIGKSDEKENEIPVKFQTPTKTTTPVQKTITVQTPKVVQKTPVVKTPTSSAKKGLPKSVYGPLSFLKSLDAEANRGLCDPDALYYRTNYKSKKHELAEKLFKLYNEKVFDSKLTNVPMKWNKKLLNTAGRCNNSRRNGEKQSVLELSDKVLTSADRLRCTLIHEMCHAATWILNGENGHGAVWKGWAAKANRAFPELPKITVCHDYVIEYRYTYLCINCRAQSKTHSKSRKVDEIQCSICKGSIKLFENKKGPAGEIVMVPVEKKELKGFAKFVHQKYKEVKKPLMGHKEVMQILSMQFSAMTVEQKANF